LKAEEKGGGPVRSNRTNIVAGGLNRAVLSHKVELEMRKKGGRIRMKRGGITLGISLRRNYWRDFQR